MTGCAVIPVIQAPPPRTNVRDVLMDGATAQLDRPYRHNGNDPTGFDDSGLVYYVFDRAGIRVPRSAAEQHASGRRVSYARMQRGDLVFFTLEGKERAELHVGMYVGEGRMVHILRDRQVELEVINNPYWQKRYFDSVSLLP